jgi:hypothetical protein
VRNECFGAMADDAAGYSVAAAAMMPTCCFDSDMAPPIGALAAAGRGRFKVTAGPHQGLLFELSFAANATV